MSVEDDMEEVYQLLSRSGSEDSEGMVLEVHGSAEAQSLADLNDQAIRKAVAKQQVREQIEANLSDDLAFTTRWLRSLEDYQDRAQLWGRDEAREWEVEDDTEQSPVADVGTKLERYLRKWRTFESGGIRQSHSLDGSDMEWMAAVEVAKRTARLLQADAYRLLYLIAYLNGRECELQPVDVKWIAPYLEGHLKLVKADHDNNMDDQHYEALDWELGSDHPSAYDAAAERMEVGPEPTYHGAEQDDISIQFSMPGFSSFEEAPSSMSKSNSIDLDIESPHGKSATMSLYLPDQLLDQNSEERTYAVSDAGLQDSGKPQQVDDTSTSQRHDQKKQPSSETTHSIRTIAEQLVKSKADLEESLVEALDVGDKLVTSNASLEGTITTVLCQLEEERKWRKVAEKQINILSTELHEERAIVQGMVNQSGAIRAHIREHEEFRIKRENLKEHLEEVQSRLADGGRKDPELDLEDSLEIEMLQAAIDDLENEKERAWLQFFAPLDEARDDKMAETSVAKAPQVDVCLYCDKEHCGGCSGFAERVVVD